MEKIGSVIIFSFLLLMNCFLGDISAFSFKNFNHSCSFLLCFQSNTHRFFHIRLSLHKPFSQEDANEGPNSSSSAVRKDNMFKTDSVSSRNIWPASIEGSILRTTQRPSLAPVRRKLQVSKKDATWII